MNILFVCTGNTCRSPMAEAYLNSKKLPNVTVKSAGISAAGDAVSENAVQVLKNIGIDISGLVSEQLSQADIAWADKIICMSLSHKTVLKMYADEGKITVLGGGISDPYGCDELVYAACRDEIVCEIDKLIEQGYFSERVVVSAAPEHIKSIGALEKVCFSEPWSEETLLDAFSRGTRFFVAVENDRVLGYVGISCILDEGYITNIAVFPEYRGCGVATALLERVFSLGKDMKLEFVSLEVRPSNTAAVSLYEKLGFKLCGRRKNFYSSPLEDALIMTKRF